MKKTITMLVCVFVLITSVITPSNSLIVSKTSSSSSTSAFNLHIENSLHDISSINISGISTEEFNFTVNPGHHYVISEEFI